MLAVKNSMAKCTPRASRPSMDRSRGLVAPAASSTASYCREKGNGQSRVEARLAGH